MSQIEFFKPQLEGQRFQDHEIPLEVLKDLSVLEDLLLAAARSEFYKQNTDRSQVPRGFAHAVTFKLKTIEPGSAIPVITAVVATSTLFAGGVSDPNFAYFERGRDSIIEAISQAEAGTNPTNIDAKLLTYFDRFGRSLRDGESIVFAREGQTPARLTPQTRRRLVLAAPGVDQITADAEIRGKIVDTNDTAGTFTIQLASSQEVVAPLPRQYREEIIDAQKKSDEGVRILLRGIAEFDHNDKLRRFESVEEVSTLDPLDVPARLDALRLLKKGWLEGHGLALNPSGLDRLASEFEARYGDNLPLPYTYPTESGGVRFEWDLGPNEPSLDINLNDFSAIWYTLNKETDADEEATLDLSEAAGWADLVTRLTNLLPQDMAGEQA